MCHFEVVIKYMYYNNKQINLKKKAVTVKIWMILHLAHIVYFARF